jgi:hypothetical protein
MLRGVLWATPPWLVSLVFHMGLLLTLAMVHLSTDESLSGVLVIASPAPDVQDEFEQLTEMELDPLEDLSELDPSAVLSEMPDIGVVALGDLTMDATIDTESDIGEIAMGETTIGEIGALFGEGGGGMSDIGDGLKAAATFFGAKSKGEKFVFVVDNSNSMTKGRFETALIELVRTVNAMTSQQKFYVIFFSDTAYPMFYPNPASELLPATDTNKRKLEYWLGTVQLCLRTAGEDAVKAALELRPDVIYILGDGAFTDKTTTLLTAPHNRTIPIHTLGMEVDPTGQQQLSAIAKANGGTYRMVGASPEARQLAKQNPRPRNNSRNGIWGIKLSQQAAPRRRKP